MEASWGPKGINLLGVRLLDIRYYHIPGSICTIGRPISPGERKMFGASEEFARMLMKERIMRTECKGEQRDWCRLEYRMGPRYG